VTTRRMYGTWHSPVHASDVALSVGFGDIAWDTQTHTLLYTERRGDTVWLMGQRGADAPWFLTDGEVSIRGGIGYGGGALAAAHGTVYFVQAGRRLMRLPLVSGVPSPITPEYGALAAPVISPDGRFIAFIHQYENVDMLAVVDSLGTHLPRKLAFGDDFYMQPAFSPDGTLLAYIAWNHPAMPFDGARLRLAHLEMVAGLPTIAQQRDLAGGDDTAVFQPQFALDGRLAYVSDLSGWWQIYIYDPRDDSTRQITHVQAEHAIPAWLQGQRTFTWSADGASIYALRNDAGKFSLWVYDTHDDLDNGRPVEALAPYDDLRQITLTSGESVALIAAATTTPEQIVSIALDNGTSAQPARIHARSRSEMRRAAWSIGEPTTWLGHDGGTVHGWYYPPFNEGFYNEGAPPLIVSVHGGPTSQTIQEYEPKIQFFTSRGFAWLEVNHRGSTGYGKAYKDLLRGAWGVYDVEDAASGALTLVERGLADARMLVITGGSAGGYTVLQSLVSKPGLYAAGVCRYGIADQFTIALNEAWKFEARYNDTLLGALPGAIETYRARSPRLHADKIVDPLLIFHGALDEVVPIDQAEGIVTALRSRGVPHAYHVYPTEGHGFRQPETIVDTLEKMLQFILTHVILK